MSHPSRPFLLVSRWLCCGSIVELSKAAPIAKGRRDEHHRSTHCLVGRRRFPIFRLQSRQATLSSGQHRAGDPGSLDLLFGNFALLGSAILNEIGGGAILLLLAIGFFKKASSVRAKVTSGAVEFMRDSGHRNLSCSTARAKNLW